jgi:hypothetical protein
MLIGIFVINVSSIMDDIFLDVDDGGLTYYICDVHIRYRDAIEENNDHRIGR